MKFYFCLFMANFYLRLAKRRPSADDLWFTYSKKSLEWGVKATKEIFKA